MSGLAPTDQVDFTVYITATGEVRSIGDCPYVDFEAQAHSGKSVIMGHVNGQTHWISGGIVVERPILQVEDITLVADGAEDVIASELPLGTEVFVDGESAGYIGVDGLVFFTPMEPGETRIHLVPPFPHQNASFKVIVNEVTS